MWVLVTIAGMAVEVAAIVALGRSVTRRDEVPAGEVDRAPAGSPGDGGPERITVELPSALAADPAAGRLLAALSRELSRSGLRVRLESPAAPGSPPAPVSRVHDLVPEPRRDAPAARSGSRDGAGGG